MKKALPLFFTLAVIALFHFTKITALKFYPSIVNFLVFLVFFLSIFSQETIIQKFAKMVDGELNDAALQYTRNLTYLWSIFLFCNFLASTATIFMSDKVWMLYNGCISYLLVGTFFAIEYIVRITCLKSSTKENTLKI